VDVSGINYEAKNKTAFGTRGKSGERDGIESRSQRAGDNCSICKETSGVL